MFHIFFYLQSKLFLFFLTFNILKSLSPSLVTKICLGFKKHKYYKYDGESLATNKAVSSNVNMLIILIQNILHNAFYIDVVICKKE